MHKSQIFGYLLISFLLGVFISSYFNNTFLATLVLVLLGVMMMGIFGYERTFAKSKKAEKYREWGIVIGACILVLALGVFRYGQINSKESILLSFADRQAGGKGVPVMMGGFVEGEPENTSSGQQIQFHVTELRVPGHSLEVAEKTLVFTQSYPKYRVGDPLIIEGALSKPKNFSDFDYIQYLKNKDVRTIVSYPKIVPTETLEASLVQRLKFNFYKVVFGVKDKFQNSINKSIPEPYAAYINGILLGTRQNIPDSLTESFNKTGTTHVLAISGYNIAIIAQALLAVLVFWMRRRKAFWVSVGIIIAFTILTGASASVVRAAIMGLLLLFANGYGRLYDSRNAILLAAALMVLIDPLSLRFDLGFQLSFLAVLGLMYIYPILENKLIKIPKAGSIKEILLMSLAAQIMVMPLLAYTFHSVSITSLPANLLMLPFMPYAMLFGFITGALGMIAIILGRLVGYIAWSISFYQIGVVKFFASLSFASVSVSIGIGVLILSYLVIGGLIYKFRK